MSLNLNIVEKVAKENFHSCAELGRATWKKAWSPELHRGGAVEASRPVHSW